MAILTNSEILDKVLGVFNQNRKMFTCFTDVYLFGSLLSSKRYPNDIDILLLYSDFSNQIIRDMELIRIQFEFRLGLQVDLTVLSINEEEETEFLRRLNSKYIKLK